MCMWVCLCMHQPDHSNFGNYTPVGGGGGGFRDRRLRDRGLRGGGGGRGLMWGLRDRGVRDMGLRWLGIGGGGGLGIVAGVGLPGLSFLTIQLLELPFLPGCIYSRFNPLLLEHHQSTK